MISELFLSFLPQGFENWFAARGWSPRPHQLDMVQLGREGKSALLIAPTGAGKTLSGFLPSLVDLAEKGGGKGLHTLYISPLKALATDVARNLLTPIEEMELKIRAEARTGDTPATKRQRQRDNPPDILFTTPEQLALLTSHTEAREMIENLSTIIVDELHALATNKRGELLSLNLARLRKLAPKVRTVGLSATVSAPEALARFLVPQKPEPEMAEILTVKEGMTPEIELLDSSNRIPWSGHSARHAYGEIYEAIKGHKVSLIFVNTRAQAEMLFQALWQINEDNLAIALHHGSLDVSQRRKVEAAMVAGKLRAVVATSTLDLGIDWGDVSLVIHVGAPKGASRLIQRIGRANHRFEEASKALLVPANRFEVMECRAAREAAIAGEQDSDPPREGGLDVLCQHILGMACADPFFPDDLYEEITSSSLYDHLPRETFDQVLDTVATGGYALKAYETYARLKPLKDGRLAVTNARVRQLYRMNVGTIVEAATLSVRFGRRVGATGAFRGQGPKLGDVEEGFLETLTIGDTFLFAGRILKLEGIVENTAYVSASTASTPKITSYAGGKLPLSSHLAARIQKTLVTPSDWQSLPEQTREWLEMQTVRSQMPRPGSLLVETFPHSDRFFLVCYPFEGRNAHQTLGMLLTRRLERAGAQPLGFVGTEYALSVWGRKDVGDMVRTGAFSLNALFSADMLGDDLEEWLEESALMQRTFAQCAQIAGLVNKRYPGVEKTGRQATVSANLIYDVLRKYEPKHVVLQAARADAARGFLDVKRVSNMLHRIDGRIDFVPLEKVSPLAVPVMLEIGREPVRGEAEEAVLKDAAAEMLQEAYRP